MLQLKAYKSLYYTKEFGDLLYKVLVRSKAAYEPYKNIAQNINPLTAGSKEFSDAYIAYSDLQAAQNAYTQWQNDMLQKETFETLGPLESVTLKQGFMPPTIDGTDINISLFDEYADAKSNAKYIFDPIFKNQKMLSSMAGGGGPGAYAKYDYLTAKEKSVIAYYISQNDWPNADKYFRALERTLNERYMAYLKQTTQQTSEKNPAIGVGINVVSSFVSPLAVAGTGAQYVKNIFCGKNEPTDINSPWFIGAQLEDASSEGVKTAAHNAVYNISGSEPAASLASGITEVGLSAVDAYSKLPFGPLGAMIYTTADAAGQTALSSQQNGANPGQALTLASVNALIKVLTDKVPVGDLIKSGSNGQKTVENLIINVINKAGAKATKKSVSQLAKTITDISVMGDKSKFQQRINELQSQGYIEYEAQERALYEFFVKDIGKAAGSGAVSSLKP